MRVGAKAAVYVTAVLEYLTAEVLELAGVSLSSFTVSRLRTRWGPPPRPVLPHPLTRFTTECRQGPEGQAYHAETSPTRHPW